MPSKNLAVPPAVEVAEHSSDDDTDSEDSGDDSSRSSDQERRKSVAETVLSEAPSELTDPLLLDLQDILLEAFRTSGVGAAGPNKQPIDEGQLRAFLHDNADKLRRGFAPYGGASAVLIYARSHWTSEWVSPETIAKENEEEAAELLRKAKALQEERDEDAEEAEINEELLKEAMAAAKRGKKKKRAKSNLRASPSPSAKPPESAKSSKVAEADKKKGKTKEVKKKPEAKKKDMKKHEAKKKDTKYEAKKKDTKKHGGAKVPKEVPVDDDDEDAGAPDENTKNSVLREGFKHKKKKKKKRKHRSRSSKCSEKGAIPFDPEAAGYTLRPIQRASFHLSLNCLPNDDEEILLLTYFIRKSVEEEKIEGLEAVPAVRITITSASPMTPMTATSDSASDHLSIAGLEEQAIHTELVGERPALTADTAAAPLAEISPEAEAKAATESQQPPEETPVPAITGPTDDLVTVEVLPPRQKTELRHFTHGLFGGPRYSNLIIMYQCVSKLYESTRLPDRLLAKFGGNQETFLFSTLLGIFHSTASPTEASQAEAILSGMSCSFMKILKEIVERFNEILPMYRRKFDAIALPHAIRGQIATGHAHQIRYAEKRKIVVAAKQWLAETVMACAELAKPENLFKQIAIKPSAELRFWLYALIQLKASDIDFASSGLTDESVLREVFAHDDSAAAAQEAEIVKQLGGLHEKLEEGFVKAGEIAFCLLVLKPGFEELTTPTRDCLETLRTFILQVKCLSLSTNIFADNALLLRFLTAFSQFLIGKVHGEIGMRELGERRLVSNSCDRVTAAADLLVSFRVQVLEICDQFIAAFGDMNRFWSFSQEEIFQQSDYAAMVCQELSEFLKDLTQFDTLACLDLSIHICTRDELEQAHQIIDDCLMQIADIAFDIFNVSNQPAWIRAAESIRAQIAVCDRHFVAILERAIEGDQPEFVLDFYNKVIGGCESSFRPVEQSGVVSFRSSSSLSDVSTTTQLIAQSMRYPLVHYFHHDQGNIVQNLLSKVVQRIGHVIKKFQARPVDERRKSQLQKKVSAVPTTNRSFAPITTGKLLSEILAETSAALNTLYRISQTVNDFERLSPMGRIAAAAISACDKAVIFVTDFERLAIRFWTRELDERLSRFLNADVPLLVIPEMINGARIQLLEINVDPLVLKYFNELELIVHKGLSIDESEEKQLVRLLRQTEVCVLDVSRDISGKLLSIRSDLATCEKAQLSLLSPFVFAAITDFMTKMTPKHRQLTWTTMAIDLNEILQMLDELQSLVATKTAAVRDGERDLKLCIDATFSDSKMFNADSVNAEETTEKPAEFSRNASENIAEFFFKFQQLQRGHIPVHMEEIFSKVSSELGQEAATRLSVARKRFWEYLHHWEDVVLTRVQKFVSAQLLTHIPRLKFDLGRLSIGVELSAYIPQEFASIDDEDDIVDAIDRSVTHALDVEFQTFITILKTILEWSRKYRSWDRCWAPNHDEMLVYTAKRDANDDELTAGVDETLLTKFSEPQMLGIIERWKRTIADGLYEVQLNIRRRIREAIRFVALLSQLEVLLSGNDGPPTLDEILFATSEVKEMRIQFADIFHAIDAVNYFIVDYQPLLDELTLRCKSCSRRIATLLSGKLDEVWFLIEIEQKRKTLTPELERERRTNLDGFIQQLGFMKHLLPPDSDAVIMKKFEDYVMASTKEYIS